MPDGDRHRPARSQRTLIGMPPSDEADTELANVSRWVALERERAQRAALVAQRHEGLSGSTSESVRAHHNRMAATYRRVEQRHLAAARLQALHALRLRRWAHGPNQGALRPAFMAAVATMLGMDSAIITLTGHDHAPGMVAASDSTARAAHDLEFVLGEGPMADVDAFGEIIVVNDAIRCDRWPQYGAAVAELGVRTVVAMPLALTTARLGTLCAFDSRPDHTGNGTSSAGQVAEALTQSVLLAPETDERSDGMPSLPLFMEADYHAVMHQAVGMVSVQCDCTLADALAILRARAFALGMPIDSVADAIVSGTTKLTP
jgi:hypothetical protein